MANLGNEQFKQQRYYLDIGPRSWTGYLVSFNYDVPGIWLTGVGTPVGGFSDFQSWDDIFSRHIQTVMDEDFGDFSNLIPAFGNDAQRTRGILEAAVQPTKGVFSLRHASHSWIRPKLDGVSMKGFRNSYFSTQSREIELTYNLLCDVTEECCRPIVERVRKHIDELFAKYQPGHLEPRSKITIALKVGVDFPRFILEMFEDEFKEVWDVDVMKTGTCAPPDVAQRNYLTLCDSSIKRDF